MHTSLLHLLLNNGDFLNTYISQGSVATRLWHGGVFAYVCYKFPTKSNSERSLKIDEYLVKLWARVRCLVFLTHGVYIYMNGGIFKHEFVANLLPSRLLKKIFENRIIVSEVMAKSLVSCFF